MDIKKKIGIKIKDLRKKNYMSQEELAQKAGIDRSYLSSVERGIKNISIEKLEKIALALGLEIKDLL